MAVSTHTHRPILYAARWLVLAGTEHITGSDAKRRIIVINTLALTTAFLILCIGLYFSALTQSVYILAGVLMEATAFFAVIVLNSQRRYYLANAATLVIHCVFGLYFGAMLGSALPIEALTAFLLTFLTGTATLVYRKGFSRRATISATLVIVAIFLLNAEYDFITPIPISAGNEHIIKTGSWIGVCILMTFIAIFTIRQNDASRQEIEELNERLKKANIAKTRFIRENNHELRTPLNAIGIAVQGMLEVREAHPELSLLDEEMGVINTSCQLAAEIINEKLDYAKIEAGRLEEVSLGPMRLADCMQDSLTINRAIARSKSISILLETEKDVPPVIISDDILLKKILNNLLYNAVKFSAESRPIRLHVAHVDGVLRFTVTNSGVIPEERAKTLFQPYQSERNYQLPGTGLGLFNTKAFVKQLQGDIQFVSKDGYTSFCFTIPLIAAATQPVAPQNTQRQLELGGYRVMIVEDDSITREAMKKHFSRLGARVLALETAEAGWQSMPGFRPDLIMCDDGLPGIQGRELIRMIRQLPDFRHIPIIVMTGNAFDDEVSDILASGATELLKKPVQLGTLHDRIIQHLFP
ncbi:response regulator [Chitinophaga horti]|uniref:histidine kinase n=1 Tax=Chitinophaga horti TaxID=2920382 RepID=A0ABY6J4R3_9BACT|nr:response regulator [Chitinophaga horti]UYQ94351.1 response regulator [Chitinophaga horti]